MGDNPPQLNYADQQLNFNDRFPGHHDFVSNGHLPNQHNLLQVQHDNLPLQNDEEPYTIKCICGFSEDDGNTVLCEHCNTWQHISCYYFPGLVVPEVHQCIDCFPRILDAFGAAQRQKRLLEPLNIGEERKPRRSGLKGTRKTKVKDSNHGATPNGGSNPASNTNGRIGSEPFGQDRKSGSPRAQPPPSKRIKTNHRHRPFLGSYPAVLESQLGYPVHVSPQITGLASPPRVPLAECPPNYFSPDFIRTHQTNTDFTPADANLYLDIGVSNVLSNWLDDRDLFAAATNGRTHDDVFQHFPQPIEELESPIKKHVHQDTSVQFHGGHPTWPYVTVERDLFAGDLVGELRGSIGLQDDYKSDPANRWNELRHPDHFVFFHPMLPIYIDCRSEGTLLRYARRSCRPNMKIVTIITGAREYRFCLTATTDIPSGSEITIAWDVGHDQQLQECLSGATMTDSPKEYVITWVETILAHFGGCACDKHLDSMCWMAYFDRRLNGNTSEKLPLKSIKSGRRKGTGKTSPTSTGHATNSRASSEALTNEQQDQDMEDQMSSRQSTRSTSMAIGQQDEAAGPSLELSAREKRKLMQQEKLFDRLEHDEHQGPRRKKRHSGSNTGTPLPSTSNPSTLSHASTLNQSTSTMSDHRASAVDGISLDKSLNALTTPDETLHQAAQLTPQRRVRTPLPRPIYADASTQTDQDEKDSRRLDKGLRRKPYVSLSQRLLKRSGLRNMQKQSSSITLSIPSPIASPRDILVAEDTQPVLRVLVGPVETSSALLDETKSGSPGEDTEMVYEPVSPPSKEDLSTPHSMDAESIPIHTAMQTFPQSSHPQAEPVAPLWPNSHADHGEKELRHRHNPASAQLHVELPPPPIFGTASSNEPVLFATPSLITSSAHLSSSGLLQMFSPPVGAPYSAPPANVTTNSLTQPSPIKKKMSLSDYMNKRKSETPATERTLAQAQQAVPLPSGGSVSLPVFSDLTNDEATN